MERVWELEKGNERRKQGENKGKEMRSKDIYFFRRT
jgi:hypothetical protein